MSQIDQQPNEYQLHPSTRLFLEALEELPSTKHLRALEAIDAVNPRPIVAAAVVAATLATGVGAASAETKSARPNTTSATETPRKFITAEPGDSQWSLSEKSGITLKQFRAENGGANRWIYPGYKYEVTPHGKRTNTIIDGERKFAIAEPGDSQWSLAVDNGLTLKQFRKENGGPSTRIFPGYKYEVTTPGSGHTKVKIHETKPMVTYAEAQPGATATGLSERYGLTLDEFLAQNPVVAQNPNHWLFAGEKYNVSKPGVKAKALPIVVPSGTTIPIKPNYTVNKIAAATNKVLGIKSPETVKKNIEEVGHLPPNDLIISGQQLFVPGASPEAAHKIVEILDNTKQVEVTPPSAVVADTPDKPKKDVLEALRQSVDSHKHRETMAPERHHHKKSPIHADPIKQVPEAPVVIPDFTPKPSSEISNPNFDQANPENGNHILQQFMVEVLKNIAQKQGVPEANAVTPEHVLALVAFAQGEGGDITNNDMFNPLNTGINAPELLATDHAGNGVQSFKSFDAGVEATARALTDSNHTRLAEALTDPSVTADQFMHALTYYQDYAGNAIWAEASMPPNQDSYYQRQLSFVQTVRSQYGDIAGLVIGTPAKEGLDNLTDASKLDDSLIPTGSN